MIQTWITVAHLELARHSKRQHPLLDEVPRELAGNAPLSQQGQSDSPLHPRDDLHTFSW